MSLSGESEGVLVQRGHPTGILSLSTNRLRSMAIALEEGGHLGDMLVCTFFILFCCLDKETVSWCGSLLFTLPDRLAPGWEISPPGLAPSIIRSVS